MLLPIVCLYGNSTAGAGWIAARPGFAGPTLGDGELNSGRSFTTAVFQACDALVRSGATGKAVVYAPGGERKATIDLSRPGWYGDLQWMAADVMLISAEDLEAADVSRG